MKKNVPGRVNEYTKNSSILSSTMYKGIEDLFKFSYHETLLKLRNRIHEVLRKSTSQDAEPEKMQL